jgi:hypothetical protein
MNGGRGDLVSTSKHRLDWYISEAEAAGRPLLLVSYEDRHPLDRRARMWIGARFAVLATFEKPRWDHRRNRLVVYEYRPRMSQRHRVGH